MSEAKSQAERGGWHYRVFHSLSISAFERIRALQNAELAALQLVSARLSLGDPGVEDVPSNQMRRELMKVSTEGVVGLRQEWLRMSLVASVTVFDTFLADLTRLLFLHQPKAIPKDKQCSFGEVLQAGSYEALLEHLVSKMVYELGYKNYGDRLKYLEKHFNLPVSVLEHQVAALSRYANLRNTVVHDAAAYRYSVARGGYELRLERKCVPEVDYRTSMEAAMMVAETIDALFVAVTRKLFKREPEVRLMTPGVISVHESLRAEWKEKSTE